MKEIIFKIIKKSDVPKYKQIANTISHSIEANVLKMGDPIPSVNHFSKKYKVSRDTVFKAYSMLKKTGMIVSVDKKGYFVAQNKIKILLLINTFKAYKEVFYHSFLNNLNNNIVIDLQFHHYNIKNFKSMLSTNRGQYYKYIVMGFDHPGVKKVLSKIDNNKLLLLDWDISGKTDNSYIFQDFGKAFYNSLKEALPLFKKYKAIYFIYPEFTYHPKESIEFFTKFCKDFRFVNKVIKKSKELMVDKGIAYISVSDRMLYELLNQCRFLNLEPGKDVGILSYNETPVKKFIYKGVSVISIDFNELGVKAAEFINEDKNIQTYIPTKLIQRESL